MRLMKFTYTILHVPGKNIATADVLSRAPGSEGEHDGQQNEEEMNLYVNFIVTGLPVTEKRLRKIQQHQEADPVLQLVKKYSPEGWPAKNRVETMVQHSLLPICWGVNHRKWTVVKRLSTGNSKITTE